ncbi:MAG: glycoside hydrolase family 3 protein [Planctomycetes bacterium]|nr:glycoside hydrolase family 3 protein [Planctomycetota bacterium]
MPDKYKAVDKALGRMTLEQKVGQLFTQSFYGTLITPDVVHMIKDMNCAGLRVTQFYRQFRHYARPGQQREAFDKSSPADMPADQFSDIKDTLCKSPYVTVEEYAAILNRLKEIAAERSYDAPLHLCLDQEGDGSADFVRGGVRFFPCQWGLARTGDPAHVYRSAKAVARQLAAVGFNVIHSPVLDVVLHPDSTYIGTRGFGTDPQFVTEMARAFVRGFREEGVMCCGKHYPGRGSTDVDDHHDLAAIERSDQEMWECELFPYRELGEDLPMIMIGHSIYPCWDTENTASCSRAIMTDVTRGRLGFKGIITTDSMIMKAIAHKYGGIPQGCLMAAKAGANLILMKETGAIRDEAYRLVLEAAKSGDLPESQIDEQVATTLRWKVDYGFYGDGYRVDAKKAGRTIRSAAIAKAERVAAEKAVHVVRDTAGVLPLAEGQRVLCVEQVAGAQLNANDLNLHPGVFWEKMLGESSNVSGLEIESDPSDEDRMKLFDYMRYYDAIVITHWSGRSSVSTVKLINELLDKAGNRKVIVVANSPLPYNTPVEWPTVICTYSPMPAALSVAARLIYGRFKPAKPARPAPYDA